MSYRVRRVDVNQPLIVKKFRVLGCSVAILSSMGNGIPDILISKRVGTPDQYNMENWSALIEIKDGSKPPSQRKLTPDEQAFHDSWQGEIYVISTEQEAIDLINSIS